jgi:hypothetical protein
MQWKGTMDVMWLQCNEVMKVLGWWANDGKKEEGQV